MEICLEAVVYLISITIPTKVGDKVVFVTIEAPQPNALENAKEALVTSPKVKTSVESSTPRASVRARTYNRGYITRGKISSNVSRMLM